jgi:hypothetical protein
MPAFIRRRRPAGAFTAYRQRRDAAPSQVSFWSIDMFGWFSHALAQVCPQATGSGCHRRWLRVSPGAMAAQLPLLGTVLYLPSCPALSNAGAPLPGWLVERIELAPLLRTCWLAAVSEIGAEGPREWLECFDAHGVLQARLYLLPDTDYLAWDAMLAAAESLSEAPLMRMSRPTRCAMAWLVCFRHRRLGGLKLLNAIDVQRLSPLGQDIANAVARGAGVHPA